MCARSARPWSASAISWCRSWPSCAPIARGQGARRRRWTGPRPWPWASWPRTSRGARRSTTAGAPDWTSWRPSRARSAAARSSWIARWIAWTSCSIASMRGSPPSTARPRRSGPIWRSICRARRALPACCAWTTWCRARAGVPVTRRVCSTASPAASRRRSSWRPTPACGRTRARTGARSSWCCQRSAPRSASSRPGWAATCCALCAAARRSSSRPASRRSRRPASAPRRRRARSRRSCPASTTPARCRPGAPRSGRRSRPTAGPTGCAWARSAATPSSSWSPSPSSARRCCSRARRTTAARDRSWPGLFNLVRSSGLCGRTSIRYVAPGERFELGWGPDADLRVSREVEALDEKSRMLSSWAVRRTLVRVKLSNLGAEPRKLSVTERLPVSEIEKVRISVERRARHRAKEARRERLLALVSRSGALRPRRARAGLGTAPPRGRGRRLEALTRSYGSLPAKSGASLPTTASCTLPFEASSPRVCAMTSLS